MKGKKKKGAKKGAKKAKMSTQFLDYKFEDFVEKEMDINGWIKIEFELMNWKYGNYSIFVKARDHVFKLFDSVIKKHGKQGVIIVEWTMQFFTKKTLSHTTQPGNFHNPVLPIFRVYKTFGAEKREDAPVFKIWYNFMPHNYSDPILLATSDKDALSYMVE